MGDHDTYLWVERLEGQGNERPRTEPLMRRNFKDVMVPVIAAIMAASCSGRQTDSTSPSIADERTGRTIGGAWAHTAIGSVYREFMTLAQSGTHVTGTGSYAIEAGREGPTRIQAIGRAPR
jgi:hypothetical protein